jgi:hypothetical protein
MFNTGIELRSFGTFALLALTILVFPGCEAKKSNEKISPELQAIKDRYDQIEEEMTEEQVDAIMAGYRSSSVKEVNTLGGHGPPFKRPSTKTKWYSKGSFAEGKYTLHVYFDNDGYVVGKDLGAWVK